MSHLQKHPQSFESHQSNTVDIDISKVVNSYSTFYRHSSQQCESPPNLLKSIFQVRAHFNSMFRKILQEPVFLKMYLVVFLFLVCFIPWGSRGECCIWARQGAPLDQSPPHHRALCDYLADSVPCSRVNYLQRSPCFWGAVTGSDRAMTCD